MTTTDEKQEPGPDLARRLVACKHFRWMPGMADHESRIVSIDGDTLASGSLLDGGADWHTAKAMGLPDLADPATLGCLLALVREAWGDDPTKFDTPVREAATEAEALVVALEAAPE